MSVSEQVINLINQFQNRQATIGVIGLGYVGLPLVTALCKVGFNVIGFDIDPEKPRKLKNGESYIAHVPNRDISNYISMNMFLPTTDFSLVKDADAILICVPTPLTKYREPDLSAVEGTLKSIIPFMRPMQLIVLESTTYPGTTRELVIPALERSGLTFDENYFVAFSPEREDPGNKDYSTQSIPKVVGGASESSKLLAEALYRQFVVEVIVVSNTDVAEAVKITENIFRAVNIALVNELKVIFSAMKIDIWEVIEAAKSKPFGYMPFYPGPGLGGHCIPIDPFYLTWKAREYELSTRFIELAGEVNVSMPRVVVTRLIEELSTRYLKSINEAKVLVIGISYKKNIDDMRESPSLKLMEILESKGAHICFHDPYVTEIPSTREHMSLAGRRSMHLTEALIKSVDAVLIATDHDNINYNMIVENALLIVDTRNVIARHGYGGVNNLAKA